MNDDALFCHLSSKGIADLIQAAQGSVGYAGPGIQIARTKAYQEFRAAGESSGD